MPAQSGALAWSTPASMRWVVVAIPTLLWAGATTVIEVLSFIPGLAPEPDPWRLMLGIPAVLLLVATVTFGPRVSERRLQQGMLILWVLSAAVNLVVILITPAMFAVLVDLVLTASAGCMYFRPRVVVGQMLLLTGIALLVALLPTQFPEGTLAPAWLAVYLPILWTAAIAVLIVRVALSRRLDEVIEQANTDPLTGLGNLRRLRQAAHELNQVGGLLLLDLDNFKTPNTLYGHLGGDEALRAVADALRSVAEPDHTIARIGGDEMAVLVPHAAEYELEIFARRYRRAIRAATSRLALPGVTLDASFGIARAPYDGSTLTELLTAADRALYAAKATRARQRAGGDDGLLALRVEATDPGYAAMLPLPVGHDALPDVAANIDYGGARIPQLYEATGYWRLFAGAVGGGSIAVLLAALLPGADRAHETVVLGIGIAGVLLTAALVLLKPAVRTLSSTWVDIAAVALLILLLWLTGGVGSPMLMLVVALCILQGTGVPRSLGRRLLCLVVVQLSPLLYQPVISGPQGAVHGSLMIAMFFVSNGLTIIMYGGQQVLRTLEKRSLQEATVDPLTRLANRRAFTGELTQKLGGNDHEFAVVMIDLDNFGEVNTMHGHQRGDALLREIAEALRGVVREGDRLARVGGDEFAAILVGVGPEAARSLATRFVRAVTECTTRNADATIANVTASAGLALYPCHGADIDELMARADESLMSVKASGKNDVALSRVAMPSVPHTTTA